jgi:hypothetical protein
MWCEDIEETIIFQLLFPSKWNQSICGISRYYGLGLKIAKIALHFAKNAKRDPRNVY